MINRFGATRVGVWPVKHLASPLQRWIYRASNRRFLATLGSERAVCLLTTRGRLTGKVRTVPVFYLRDSDTMVICNVRPEFERTNPRVVNLTASPVARVRIGREVAQ